jgi:broad specificity phosphatase PhoE
VIVGVRHARVWNPDGLVYASLPGFHLSEDGRAAALKMSESLVSAPVRAVYSSPLDRAMETASILAALHGLPVSEDRRLIEWAFWSHWQGMPWTRIRERDPHLLDVYGRDPAEACPEEPLQSVGERVLEWAADAELSHPDGLVLGVSHEAPLIAASRVGTGRDVSDFHATNLPHLGTVRLRPGPTEVVDLAEWARTW